MQFLLMMLTIGISVCDSCLLTQNDDLNPLDSVIREMVTKILLQEFGSYKCLIALSDVPEGLACIDAWFSTIIRVSLVSGDVPVERLLVSAVEADCQGLVVRCREAAECVNAFLMASKFPNRRVNCRLLVVPEAQSPRINVSAIFALQNIDLVPDILVARMVNNNDSFELVTLSLAGEETWRDERVVAQWLPGQGLHPPSAPLYPDRLAQLAGRRLVLITFNYPPYVILDSDANLFDGVETRIVFEFMKKMNATWTVVEDSEYKWGTVWENGSGTGVFGALATDQADVGYNGIYTWYPEYLYVGYSHTYMRAAITCLAPRPQLKPGWQVPLLPFSPPLWTAIGCSLVLATAALYTAKKLSNWVLGSSEGPGGGRYATVEDCFFRSWGLLFLQTPDLERRHTRVVGPTRHVLSWLLITYLLITASYGSGLSSVLTIPRYEPPIDTVADLHKSGLQWSQTDIAFTNSLRDMTDQVYLDLLKRFQVLPPDVLHSRVTTRDLAFAIERLPGDYFAVGDYIDEEAVSKWLRPMREDIYWNNVVLAVRKGWPYLEHLNNVVDRLFEAGIINTWEGQISREWLVPRVQLAAQLGLRSYAQAPDGPINLQLTHVQGEFALLIIGLWLSLGVFLLEIAVHRKTSGVVRLELTSTIKLKLGLYRPQGWEKKRVHKTALPPLGHRRRMRSNTIC